MLPISQHKYSRIECEIIEPDKIVVVKQWCSLPDFGKPFLPLSPEDWPTLNTDLYLLLTGAHEVFRDHVI